MGDLPNLQRIMGLSPRRGHLEEPGPVDSHAGQYRSDRRQLADECRADRHRRTGSPRRRRLAKVYRDWMAQHSEAIYGCTASALVAPQDCRLTQNGDLLYAHIFAYPFRHLYVDGIGDRLAYAEFLHDGSEIAFTVSATTTRCNCNCRWCGQNPKRL